MELRWTEDNGRECIVRFPTEAEARQCADGLRIRGVQDLLIIDNDGEIIPYS